MTPPAPMPSAAAMPSRRDRASDVRTTKTKLGPGLTAPNVSAPRMLRNGMSVSIARASEQRVGAVDDEAVAAVIGGGVTHEIDGDAAEILGLAEAAHGNARHHVGDEFLVGHQPFGHVALDPAGQDGVGGDAVARQLDGERARQRVERRLARGIMLVARRAEARRHARGNVAPPTGITSTGALHPVSTLPLQLPDR